MRLFILPALILSCTLAQAQPSYTIHGKVSLPDGKPASRVTVHLTGALGLNQQATTDDQGQYEFFGIPSGRFTLSVINPDDRSQTSDQVSVDTARVAGQRVLVHLYLKKPVSITAGESPDPVVSVREMTERIPKKARKAYEEALQEKTRNRLDRAEAKLKRAILLHPGYFQALTARGEIFISQGRCTEALEDFGKALIHHPHYGPALRGSGYCLLEESRFQESVDHLEKAVSIDPSHHDAHLFLGIALLASNQASRAEENLRRALALDPRRAVSAHIYLAQLYAAQQDYQAAAEEVAAYLEIQPDAPHAERLRAQQQQWRRQQPGP
jgi:tetratricopeptide (TPR) repeat protein